MNPEKLKDLGLTEAESKVYIALLELGNSTTGKILEKSKISSSKIYLILDKLNSKGLVSEILKNNVKNYEAKDPNRLLDYLEKKESEIKAQKKQALEIIKELNILKNKEYKEEHAEILKGTSGIKTFLEYFIQELKENDEMYIMGATQDSIKLMGNYFNEWHKKRVQKKIYCYALYNHDAESRAKFRSKTTYTETKVLPKEVKNPTYVVIGQDISAIFSFGNKPLCIVIKNEDIAKSHKEYFKILWEKGK